MCACHKLSQEGAPLTTISALPVEWRVKDGGDEARVGVCTCTNTSTFPSYTCLPPLWPALGYRSAVHLSSG